METECYFSTFIDELTITCSKIPDFDEHGWPVNECKEYPCDKIKDIRKKEKIRIAERDKKEMVGMIDEKREIV